MPPTRLWNLMLLRLRSQKCSWELSLSFSSCFLQTRKKYSATPVPLAKRACRMLGLARARLHQPASIGMAGVIGNRVSLPGLVRVCQKAIPFPVAPVLTQPLARRGEQSLRVPWPRSQPTLRGEDWIGHLSAIRAGAARERLAPY